MMLGIPGAMAASMANNSNVDVGNDLEATLVIGQYDSGPTIRRGYRFGFSQPGSLTPDTFDGNFVRGFYTVEQSATDYFRVTIDGDHTGAAIFSQVECSLGTFLPGNADSVSFDGTSTEWTWFDEGVNFPSSGSETVYIRE